MAGKIKYHHLSNEQRKQYLGDFYHIVNSLRGYEEIKNFFKDLLTTSEMVMISRRIQIAKLLIKSWTYRRIKEKLGVGIATIVQVDKWLNEGFGGYRQALKKINAGNIDKLEKIPPAPFSLDHIRRKYPSHFALLNLLMDRKK